MKESVTGGSRIPSWESDEEDHTGPQAAFAKAFAKQNIHFEKAIQSLDALNEQLIAFVFSPNTTGEALHISVRNHGEAEDPIKAAINLMRKLLLDAQSKFRKMVEENKALGGRLDADLASASQQMTLLRAELSDTSRRVSQLSSPLSSPSTSTADGSSRPNGHPTDISRHTPNGTSLNNGLPDEEDEVDGRVVDGWSQDELRQGYQQLRIENQKLKKERRHAHELQHAKEALSALKGDRKRLKAEKFELLNQMKELYATLEEKEKELRDFIRNYEQRMRESEATQLRLVTERDEAERERWTILRHARDEAERGISLATQLNLRETQVQQLQEELHEAKRHLSQYGIYADPDRSTSSTNATSHYSIVSSLTAYATLGDSRSSADSGVRLSSDRDSSANHGGVGASGGASAAGNLSDSPNEGASLDLCGDGSGGEDSMSVISTATLPQLFITPRDSPHDRITFASLTRSLDAGNLSRSAEQLLQAEAEARRRSGRRNNGAESLSRGSSTGAKGAWGSISRVFARNKQRRNLDPSVYDAMHGGGQRSSWSPQGSVPQSPITEQESYGDKLRALEEAATLPMELWRASMVQAWVEVSLGMPQYGTRCGDNVKSGKLLLELTDADLESELGISHPLHRKKLRLAIEEHRNPALVRFPCIVELSHVWVSSEWLPDIGLPQYAENFAGALVDARLLEHLSKKDLEKYLGVTRKFHLAAIAHGVHLLRMVAYDRQHLAERRRQCSDDPLVWTNHHFLQWARSIDLNEYAENLKGSGVHGAFAVLEPSFNGDTLASAMGIPPSKQIIRRHLATELDLILLPARAKITQQYRVTKPRYATLEKQGRGDSLGRSAAPPVPLGSDQFRRSTDENRRRMSLRGSLSRALGLKLKNDLQGQSVEKGESPPPLPLGPHPGKQAAFIQQGRTQSLNGDASPLHYASSHHQPRPHSVITQSPQIHGLGSKTYSHEEEAESPSRSSNSEDTSEASRRDGIVNPSPPQPVKPPHPPPESIKLGGGKHRRTTSIGGGTSGEPIILTHHPVVHTPV